ncbi:MAG: dihydrolipoyl dehydrogenase [Bacteroidota bacterium]|nr:dihydrolipoyl dehydrogenase [Bacteroidota bacterium]
MLYNLVVIGSGPGGYVAAIRAAQLGMKVAVIEKAEPGGVCLNWGCIPTKSLLKSAQVYDYIKHAQDYGITISGEVVADFEKIIERSRGVAEGMSKGIQYLLKKNKIDIIEGFGKIIKPGMLEVTDSEEKTKQIEAEKILIATGARSRELPTMKQDGEKIIGYREALVLPQKPASMIVVGSGAIGTELASFYNSMGTAVTLVEFMPEIVPNEDVDVSKALARSLKKAKIKIMSSSSVESVDTSGDLCKVTIKTKKGEEVKEAEIVLSAVGITPNTENLGLEEVGVKTDRGWIEVDEYYQTNIAGIFAIGDVIPGIALAHVASAEGIICVEKMAGKHPETLDYNNIPGCTYTNPEVASVGYTEAAAQEAGYEIKVGKFPFTASGKASASGAKEGFIKLIFDTKHGELLGAHMIGANVTEMIAEIVVARKLEITGEELIKSVHPHPTMSEAVMEAAAAANDEVIHL